MQLGMLCGRNSEADVSPHDIYGTQLMKGLYYDMFIGNVMGAT